VRALYLLQIGTEDDWYDYLPTEATGSSIDESFWTIVLIDWSEANENLPEGALGVVQEHEEESESSWTNRGGMPIFLCRRSSLANPRFMLEYP
jgi:hypothetical protein